VYLARFTWSWNTDLLHCCYTRCANKKQPHKKFCIAAIVARISAKLSDFHTISCNQILLKRLIWFIIYSSLNFKVHSSEHAVACWTLHSFLTTGQTFHQHMIEVWKHVMAVITESFSYSSLILSPNSSDVMLVIAMLMVCHCHLHCCGVWKTCTDVEM